MKLRYEIDNDMIRNGESWLQENILRIAEEDFVKTEVNKSIVVFDIGSNVGNWTKLLLSKVESLNNSLEFHIHCFEPVSSTYKTLKENLESYRNVSLWNFAMSDNKNLTKIFIYGSNSGINSLHRNNNLKGNSEEIETTTCDQFTSMHKINGVELIKIDTEGHDMSVLKGLEKLLNSSSVNIIQFEYNHCWLRNNSSLLDVFKLIEPYHYCLAKLSSNRILLFEEWHFELDRFFEGNYLIVNKDYIENLNYVNMKFGKSNELIYSI